MNDTHRAATRSLDRALAVVALGAVLALSLAACLRKIWAADYWWQHAAGRFILEHGWPTLDVFSYTARDRPWMEMRWLFCVVQYRIEAWAGPAGLIGLKWLAVVAAFTLVSLPVARKHNRLGLAAVLCVALLASSQRFFVRPELVTYVLIGLFVWILDRHRSVGGRAVFFLPLVQVLWVNTHPLFIFGPLLVGLALSVSIVPLVLHRDTAGKSATQARLLGAVLAATALACLVNPYGIHGALHPFLLFSEMRGSVFADVISELKSPFAFGAAYTAVLWYKALIGLCIVAAALNLRRLDPFWSLFCLSQLYLSTLSIRNLPFFCLAAVPFVIDNLNRSEMLEGLRQKHAYASARRAIALAVAAAVVAVCALYSWRMVTDRISVRQNDSNQFGVGIVPHRFPVDSVDFIQKQAVGGRVYATLLESAYLVSRGVEVFADPRLEVYGEAIFSRYIAAQSGATAWRDVVAEFDIRTALVDLRSGLCRFLLSAPDWKLVHFDSVAAVFVRADLADRPLVTPADYARVLDGLRADLPHPRPYADSGLFQRVEIPKPYLALSDFLLAAGRAQEAKEWLADAQAAGPFLPGMAERQLRLAESARDWPEVVRQADLALRETPDDARLMILRGEAHYRLNQDEQAAGWLSRSLTGLPDRALTWSTLGRIHMKRQNLPESERCFRRAVELAPGEAIYHSSLARVQALAGRGAEAIGGLERALALEPNNVSVLRDLIQLNLAAGDRAAAGAYLSRGLALDPGNAELQELRARSGL